METCRAAARFVGLWKASRQDQATEPAIGKEYPVVVADDMAIFYACSQDNPKILGQLINPRATEAIWLDAAHGACRQLLRPRRYIFFHPLAGMVDPIIHFLIANLVIAAAGARGLAAPGAGKVFFHFCAAMNAGLLIPF
ncbi:MAG TPA: hypothetical protein VN436_11270 [Holophaga sp.]|nr:hypothetical protein [Holophaga sp.]